MELNDLTLTSVHDSIEKNISEVKQQLNEIKRSSGDVMWLKNFVNNTLKPTSDLMSFYSINKIEEVRKLIIATEEVFPDKIETSLRSNKEVLPPVVMQNSISPPKKRVPRATAIRYPILTSPILPKIYRNKMKIAQHRCRLKHFQDLWERQVTVLRQNFIQITQKVLLPLKTFCKPTQQIVSREELKKDESSVKRNSHQLEQIEFFIVEIMNSVKELLWHQEDIREDNFSKKGISQEISEQIDCKRFGVVRLVPDIIQKLELVIQQSTVWLKHDLWYTQNSKSALCRAHRRCLKTERLWQQACQIHERLSSEWNKASEKYRNSVNKLDTVEQRISSLQEEIMRLEGQNRIIKMKIQMNKEIENPEHLQTRQRAILKRLNSTKTKLEVRERSFILLKSHSSSLKQIRSRTADKLVISENEVEMLQEKMLKIRLIRAAWHRRYHQKSDPEILRQQYQAVKLNIPLPAVREKTFVLKTRAEHLKEAAALVRNQFNPMKWEHLCKHLYWTNSFIKTLPNISDKNIVRSTEEEDSASSTTSSNSTSNCNCSPLKWMKVASYIRTRFPNQSSKDINIVNRERLGLLLKLWMMHSGTSANAEKLQMALNKSERSAEDD